MTAKTNDRILLGFSAFLLAACAAYFSVTGLGKLFNSVAVMVMAGSLEFAKLVTAAYLKQKWEELGLALKFYLSLAVVILMLVTSMGIYGYLSDAFQQQMIRIDQVERKIQFVENKIGINQKEILRYTLQNENLTQIRNSQEANYSKLINDQRATGRISAMIQNADKDISVHSAKIDSLNTLNINLLAEIDSVKNQNVDLEQEIGGFRFIAETFNIPLKSAVKWFILMIVFVFDPFAIALLLAYTQRKKMEKVDKNWVVGLKEKPITQSILEKIGDGGFIVNLGEDAERLEGYEILHIASENPEAKKHQVFSGNVTPLLKTYKCPKIFDLLQIDIRGQDYWVLKEIFNHYKPRLIVAKFNSSIEHGKSISVENDTHFKWSGDNYFGFSFEAGKRLGQQFGYTVVHQEDDKMFLVANEYLQGVIIPEVTYAKTNFKVSERAWIDV